MGGVAVRGAEPFGKDAKCRVRPHPSHPLHPACTTPTRPLSCRKQVETKADTSAPGATCIQDKVD